MGLSSIFQKLFSPYKASAHRELYEHIADIYLLTPNRVYKLAHGKRPKTFNESQAVKELLDQGIIHQ